MEQKYERLVGTWYGTLQDLLYCLESIDAWIKINVVTAEYIVAEYVDGEEDVEIMVKLGGTPRAITIESIEEIYRG